MNIYLGTARCRWRSASAVCCPSCQRISSRSEQTGHQHTGHPVTRECRKVCPLPCRSALSVLSMVVPGKGSLASRGKRERVKRWEGVGREWHMQRGSANAAGREKTSSSCKKPKSACSRSSHTVSGTARGCVIRKETGESGTSPRRVA